MKVSALKQQVKNPERVSIFVDGRYGFSLSLNELLAEKIKNGDEIDQARLNKLKKLSADGKLRARALEWALNRPRSIREFRDYLRRKKTEPEMADKLVEDFCAKGYLHEKRFSEWLVELRAESGKSNRAIAAELASKGIDRELAAEVLSTSTVNEAVRLQQVIAKKSRLSRYQQDPQKLMAYLARQGFSYDLIKDQLASADD